jgi:hypothetical protein
MFHYAVNVCNINGEDFIKLFITSSVSKKIENGEPSYLSGKSGVELLLEVVKETMSKDILVEIKEQYSRSKEYWIGWAIAYYQWYSNRKFKDIFKVFSFENLQKMYYTLHEADITKFWEEFKKLQSEVDYKLSFNTIMMKVMVEGLKAAPRLNAHMKYNHTSSSGKLIVKKHVDVAMPYIFETGETFPIKILHAEEKSLKELQFAVNDVIERAEKSDINRVLFDLISQRMVGFILKGKFVSTAAQIASGFIGKGKVTKVQDMLKTSNQDGTEILMEELNEGTVCFTNWSSLGKDFEGNVAWTPLLYPQVFLMAIGNTRDREYAFRNEKGEVDLGTKKMLPITLVFDHRLGGFADLAPFIKKLNEIFDNPEIIREW